MLTAVGRGRRRLFRCGDAYNPAREGAPTHPERESLPQECRPLVDWYVTEFDRSRDSADPVEELMWWTRSTGLWKGIDPDAHVRELRAGWE
jgi:hypothetical protein